MDAEELLEKYAKGERNFAKAKLRGIDLKGANLSGIILEQADLSGSELSEANLNKARLGGANFSFNSKKPHTYRSSEVLR